MGGVSSGRRYRVGRDVLRVGVAPEGVSLEGYQRLRPGQLVTLTSAREGDGGDERSARVHSWYVAKVGKNGTLYRGECQWTGDSG